MDREYVIIFKEKNANNIEVGSLILINGIFKQNLGEVAKIIGPRKLLTVEQNVYILDGEDVYFVHSLNGILPPPYVQSFDSYNLSESIVLGPIAQST